MSDPLQDAWDFLAFREDGASPFPELGATIAEFELREEIGRGSGGVVYRAFQASLQREVALKLVPLAVDEMSGAAMARIDREARVLASLEHPNVVRVYATGAIPGFRWLAMELVEGWSLAQVLNGEVDGLPKPGSSQWIPFCLRTLQQLAAALDSAHQRGVVHRDVKPSNILVDPDERAYLIDFGLARPEAVTGATVTEGFVGTPRYASPEQARGEPLTPASDVFSLGAVAFEMLVGVPAFSGNTAMEVLYQVQHRDPLWPKSPALAREMRAVIDKCLEKEIPDAYQTADEVGEEFARLLRFEPVMAHYQRPWMRHLRRWARQPHRIVATIGLATLAIAMVVVSWDAFRNRQSVEQLEVSSLQDELEALFHRGSPASFQVRAELLLEQGHDWVHGLLADDALLAEDFAQAAEGYREARAAGVFGLSEEIGLALAEGDRSTLLAVESNPQVNATLRARLMLAQRAIWLEENEHALQCLDHALELDPASYPTRMLRAVALRALGRKQEAVEDLQLALAIRPESRRATILLSAVWTSLGEHALARDLRLTAVERWPQDGVLLADLALSYLRLDQLALSIQTAEEAMRVAPNEAWPIAVLATAVGAEPDAKRARALVDQGLAQHPRSLPLILRDGWLSLEESRFEQALASAQSLKAQGSHYWTCLGLELEAEYWVRQEAHDRAFEVFRELSELDPDVVTWPWQASRCLIRLERLDEAQEWVSRALDQAPQEVDLLLASCWIHRRRGAWLEANLAATRALGVEPENGQAAYWVARTWYDMGQPGAAIAYIRQATVAIPHWTDAWILRAVIAIELPGQLEEARASYEEALGRESIPAVRADYAEVLDQLGADEEALAQYQAARQADPQLPTAWCGEGLLRLRSEDPAVRDVAEAVRLLEEACRLLPEHADYAVYLAEAKAALESDR